MLKSYLFRCALTACCSSLLINLATAQSIINDGNPQYLPFLSTPLIQDQMIAPPKTTTTKTKTYILAGTPATTQWGVFNKDQPPVLRIHSGDSVVIETLMSADNQIVPGVAVEKVIEMNNAIAVRGPHTITGPIYIEHAEPGDVLRIHFNKIVPRAYASNDNIPGRGLFPEKFPKGQIKYFHLDVKNKKMQFAPGIVVPLRPFPGLIAVAQAKSGKLNTSPPGNFGGNLDLREMVEGTTLYLPVFVKGALLWSGDSHAGQGNGEINLTAIETAFSEFNVTINLIKNRPLDRPLIETPTHWITVGYDRNLNKALDSLINTTTKFIMTQRHVSSQQAEAILNDTWNCPIAEVVDGVLGTYCMIPKNIHAAKPLPLPNSDTATQYITYAKNVDALQAMKQASFEMLNKIVKLKKLTPLDTYSLLSIAMDCRFAPYHSPNKEVHCMLDKNLWVNGSSGTHDDVH